MFPVAILKLAEITSCHVEFHWNHQHARWNALYGNTPTSLMSVRVSSRTFLLTWKAGLSIENRSSNWVGAAITISATVWNTPSSLNTGITSSLNWSQTRWKFYKPFLTVQYFVTGRRITELNPIRITGTFALNMRACIPPNGGNCAALGWEWGRPTQIKLTNNSSLLENFLYYCISKLLAFSSRSM